MELFSKICFPKITRPSINKMHKFIFEFYQKHVEETLPEREGYRLAIAAPRGAAKSTLISLILPIHSILYEKERYIVIISATLKQAKQRLKNIRNELLSNKNIAEIFETKDNPENKWNAASIKYGAVQADVFSAGSEMRGISLGDFRPTKIILDDAESSESAETAEGREKLLEWFKEIIDNLGDKYTRIEVIGTLLHPKSLLSTLLERADFVSARFKSVESFSNETILWEKWQNIYTDLANPHREDDAKKFFLQNKTAMLNGTKVLWEEKEDYYELMRQLAIAGRRAFFKEKQNDPSQNDRKIFNPTLFKYFTSDENGDIVIKQNCPGAAQPQASAPEPVLNIRDLRIYGFLDSAMGKGTVKRRKEGDYAAIITIGRDVRGYIFVLNAWMERASPSRQIEQVFALSQKYDYAAFGIETNCFQELLMLPLEEERERRRNVGDFWEVKICQFASQIKKENRISALEPLVSNGWLLFEKNLPKKFFDQLEDFPRGLHDDAPDALASAIKLEDQITSPQKTLLNTSQPRKTRSIIKGF